MIGYGYKIEGASIELSDGRGDGAYDLLDVEGDSLDVAQAIEHALRTADLSCDVMSAREDKRTLYLNLRIEIKHHSNESVWFVGATDDATGRELIA